MGDDTSNRWRSRVVFATCLAATGCGDTRNDDSGLFGDADSGQSGATVGDGIDDDADGTVGQDDDADGSGADGLDGSDGPKFDLQSGEGEGGDPGECGCGATDWSYVWVA